MSEDISGMVTSLNVSNYEPSTSNNIHIDKGRIELFLTGDKSNNPNGRNCSCDSHYEYEPKVDVFPSSLQCMFIIAKFTVPTVNSHIIDKERQFVLI